MAEKKEQKRVPGYKSENQKNKSLLVMQYILKNADDEHAVTIGQIEDHLAKYGIEAEQRSIYRDIHDLMDCGQHHPGLPERTSRPHERSISSNGGCVQSVGTGYDSLPCPIRDGECQVKGEADRAPASEQRGHPAYLPPPLPRIQE